MQSTKEITDLLEEGRYEEIEKNSLSQSTILSKDKNGSLILHQLAYRGLLQLVDRATLSPIDYLVTDKDGNTIFHWATLQGNVSKLPKDLLTPISLGEVTNHKGKSCIDLMLSMAKMTSNYKDLASLLKYLRKKDLDKVESHCKSHEAKAGDISPIQKAIEAEKVKRTLVKKLYQAPKDLTL
jgi:hypothetical protein